MSAQIPRPIGIIAFASALLASGLGVSVPVKILPRRRTAIGTIAQIGRNSVSVGTYERVANPQNREPC